MPFPTTIEELHKAGYKYESHKTCAGRTCEAVIELWRTPAGQIIPLDIDDKGNVVPHWSRCPNAEQFRR